MDERAMMHSDAWPMFVTLPVSFAGGIILGFLYFQAVRATADLIVNGGPPALSIALTLGRLCLLGVGFTLALQAGALALLATLAGVLAGRGLTTRRTQGAR
ncbi:MAG: ATP synthase subunit I [Pseudorhodobacter sp.]|nr:ATP synthase subunit I [Pseudorhodobacter sp.]